LVSPKPLPPDTLSTGTWWVRFMKDVMGGGLVGEEELGEKAENCYVCKNCAINLLLVECMDDPVVPAVRASKCRMLASMRACNSFSLACCSAVPVSSCEGCEEVPVVSSL
jgi:hypothetical protein